MSDLEDWQKPMRPLPGPVASEGSQMSVAEREALQRATEELARKVRERGEDLGGAGDDR